MIKMIHHAEYIVVCWRPIFLHAKWKKNENNIWRLNNKMNDNISWIPLNSTPFHCFPFTRLRVNNTYLVYLLCMQITSVCCVSYVEQKPTAQTIGENNGKMQNEIDNSSDKNETYVSSLYNLMDLLPMFAKTVITCFWITIVGWCF